MWLGQVYTLFELVEVQPEGALRSAEAASDASHDTTVPVALAALAAHPQEGLQQSQ
jgi:hypothetical protein